MGNLLLRFETKQIANIEFSRRAVTRREKPLTLNLIHTQSQTIFCCCWISTSNY